LGYQADGAVNNSYSIGSVTDSSDSGGFIGKNNKGNITNSFWDINTSGIDTSDGGTGKTTSEMQDITTFNDTSTEGLNESWDIETYENYYDELWYINNSNSYPRFGYEVEKSPEQPILNYPKDGTNETTTNVTLNITTIDGDADDMNVSLYTYTQDFIFKALNATNYNFTSLDYNYNNINNKEWFTNSDRVNAPTDSNVSGSQNITYTIDRVKNDNLTFRRSFFSTSDSEWSSFLTEIYFYNYTSSSYTLVYSNEADFVDNACGVTPSWCSIKNITVNISSHFKNKERVKTLIQTKQFDTNGAYSTSEGCICDGAEMENATASFLNFTVSDYIETAHKELNTPSKSDITYNWDNLNTGETYYWFSQLDDGSTVTTSETWNFTTDGTSPNITIIDPENKIYGYNDSLPLNYTVNDTGVGVDSCWYNVYNETNDLIIDNTTLTNCENSTFSLPDKDTDYTLNLYSNDTENNLGVKSRNFGVRTKSPAIELHKPQNNDWLDYNENILFNFTSSDSDGIDTCKLYSNWTGDWKVNETFDSVTSGTTVETKKNISDSKNNIWNVWCNDTIGNSGFALENYTFSVDTIKPNISIDYIITTEDSQTISFNTTSNDKNLKECYYSIYDSDGNIDGLNSNVTFTCNQEGSATVTDYGNYTLVTWVEDMASNTDKDNLNFTVSESADAGGGDGTEIVTPEAEWDIFTQAKKKSYEIFLANERTFELYFTNNGTDEQTISISCESTLAKGNTTNETINNTLDYDICRHIEFSEEEFDLPPGQDIGKFTEFTLKEVDDLERGLYVFNIVAEDELGREKILTVKATQTNLFFQMVMKLTSSFNIGELAVGYWVLYLFVIVPVVTLILSAGVFGIIGMKKGKTAISLIISLLLGVPIIWVI